MALPVSTDTLNSLISSSLRDFAPRVTAQIYDALPILAFMRKGDRVREITGGLQIARNLARKANPTFQQYSGAEVADTSESDPFTQARYDWSFARAAIRLTDIDIFKNSGDKHRIFSLVDELRENAMRTMEDEMSQLLHGGLAGPTGAQFNGLNHMIPESDQTIGGISQAGETWWRNVRVTGGTALNLQEKISETYTEVVRKVPARTKSSIVGVTTPEVVRELEDQLGTHGRFTMEKEAGTNLSFGLNEIFYRGVPLLADHDAQASDIRILNTEYLYLVVAPDRNFSTTEMRRPYNAEFSVAFIRFGGNLVSEHEAAQAVLVTDIT